MRRRFAGRTWPVVLAALRISAEAGWICVVYASAAVVISHGDPLLGPIEFGALVTLGVLIGRFARVQPELGAIAFVVGVVAGGALGWAASPEARDLMPTLPRALSVHLAGWIGALAVARGALVSVGERAASELERLLQIVPPALGLVWAYTTFAVRPALWLPFAVSAMWGTILFLSAALVAIGIARLNLLHSDVSDVRQKRAWRWMVIGVGFGVVPVAVPLAILGGIPLSALMTPVVGPVQWTIGLLAIPLSLIVAFLTFILGPLAPGVGELLDLIGNAIARRGEPQPDETSALGVALGVLLLIVVGIIVALAIFHFARWLLLRRRLTSEETSNSESRIDREIVVPEAEARVPRAPRRLRRRSSPHDVVAAYVAALAELENDPRYARRPSETPAQHTARIRDSSMKAGPDVARLAAGYQLARYGERRITALENLRALGRFQRIRRAARS